MRRRPSLVGIEQPALREVPAWRPRDAPGRWSRGYVDLVGLDGHGDVRLVETKVAANDDPLLVLRALDYLTRAHAYREALLGRLGASPAAQLRLDLVIGADDDDEGAVSLPRYTPARLAALDDVPWSLHAVRDWFGPDAAPRATTPPNRTAPKEWTRPRPVSDRFRDTCRETVARWKATTPVLPDAARQPAAWSGADPTRKLSFCLPPEYAAHNLLPDVRTEAIALFAELDIPWHRGHGGQPVNHLLSSQVQCVNALARMVREPDRLEQAFGAQLDIAEVLPVETGRYLTFEFIGSTDVLGEGRGGQGGPRRRGAQNTSVDAAFRYRTRQDTTELALVEWKYTEEYRRGRPVEVVGDVTRRQRYEHLWAAADGPLRTDIVPFEDMLAEPFYQLMRQELLGHELEKIHESGADVVRVVHVLPPANAAYQESLTRDNHRRAGSTVDEVWARPLRRPDRFVKVDPAVFLDPAVTRRSTSAATPSRRGPGDESADDLACVPSQFHDDMVVDNRRLIGGECHHHPPPTT